MTHNIEDKEIRGMSVRTIRWLIGCSLSIILTVGGSYTGLQKRLDGYDTNNQIMQLKIQTIQIEEQKLEAEIQSLQINQQSSQLTLQEIKTKLNIND